MFIALPTLALIAYLIITPVMVNLAFNLIYETFSK